MIDVHYILKRFAMDAALCHKLMKIKRKKYNKVEKNFLRGKNYKRSSK